MSYHSRMVKINDQMAVWGDPVHQLVQRTVLNDPSVIDDDQPPAKLLDITQIMGGQYDRCPAALVDLSDKFSDSVF